MPMKVLHFVSLCSIALPCLIAFGGNQDKAREGEGVVERYNLPEWPWDDLALVPADSAVVPADPIIIAIIDDAFDIHDTVVEPYIFQNSLEIPNNGRDDDANGRIDDFRGWDVSDRDSEVTSPPGMGEIFFHGDAMLSHVLGVVERTLGSSAKDKVKILPVKAMKDLAERPVLDAAFEGIAYALDLKADLILCSWNQAFLTSDEERILERAYREEVLIIASAGNESKMLPQYPAAHPSSLAVTAHDGLGVLWERAAFGPWVDLSAPGVDLPIRKEATAMQKSGTSHAAALVAGMAASLKAIHPEWSISRLRAALVNGATPTTQNGGYGNLMGSGKVSMRGALESAGELPSRHWRGNVGWLSGSPEGSAYRLGPFDHGEKIEFLPDFRDGFAGDFPRIEFNEPQGRMDLLTLRDAWVPQAIPNSGEIIDLRVFSSVTERVGYRVIAKDPAKIFASGQSLVDHPSTFDDGSGPLPYAPRTDARWLIKAPEGQRTRLTFQAFDTEKNVDKVYLFNGDETHFPIIAVLSGNTLPPVIESWSETTLLWFVSDYQNQGQGWEVTVEFFPLEEAE